MGTTTVIYLLVYSLICYALIALMRISYTWLGDINASVTNQFVSNSIAIVQYLVAAVGPAMWLAGIFTIMEVAITGRRRIFTSYTLSFLNLFISFAGFAAAVFVFEKVLSSVNYSAQWDVSNSEYSAVISYLIAFGYFFISDFLLYWVHRLEHSNKALWYLHKIHHAVEDMDSVSGAFHPLSNIIRWMLTILPLSFFVKINLADALIFAAFLSGVHFVQHTRAPLNFGWFGKIIGDNKFHFVHHSKNPKHYNKNFAAIFPVIDMIFGTYLEPSKNNLPETGLDHLKGAETVKQFLSGKLQPR